MFVPGTVYRRRDLHETYGGQQQGGISTPANHLFIMLFTSDRGQDYGYRDGWNEDGVYIYTGEGQHGDMSFVRGNAAILHHMDSGKDLHLFEYEKTASGHIRSGYVRYIGSMKCVGYQEHTGIDGDAKARRIISFKLIQCATE
jgi:hypothetical protein